MTRSIVATRALFAAALAFVAFAAPAARGAEPALDRARRILDDVRVASYPELRDVEIQTRAFSSASDFFQCRFDLRRFVLGRRMRYVLFVNPRAFELDAPEAGLRAIVAHELGHIVYYRRHKRLRLLGLARLTQSGYRARFERWADLQALSRGYGDGLAAYREWLYQRIPARSLAEKRRDYFSPEEIAAIVAAAGRRPALYAELLRHVPRNLGEIERACRASERDGGPERRRPRPDFSTASNASRHSTRPCSTA